MAQKPKPPTTPHKIVIVNRHGTKKVKQHIRHVPQKPLSPPPDQAA